MAPQQIRPYGSWASPITANDAFAKFVGLVQVQMDGDDLYWAEFLPEGRTVIVRQTPDGERETVTPPNYDVRTRVHEYGGGEYLAADQVVYFSNFGDQRLYRQAIGGQPAALTPSGGMRYADASYDRHRGRLIAVREDHTTQARWPINSLVAVEAQAGGDSQVLVSGNDFYAAPRVSPDGARLAWLTWNQPNMPWDGTELWVGEFAADGKLVACQQVAGGAADSITQPTWSADGRLYWISDQTGWWNLYRCHPPASEIEPLYPMQAEFAQPQWWLGMSSYAFASEDTIICAYVQNGVHYLGALDTRTRTLQKLELPYCNIIEVRAAGGRAVFTAGSATTVLGLMRLDIATGQIEVLRSVRDNTVEPAYFSYGRPIEYPTDGGKTAHAFFYAPANRDFKGPADEHPPLLVMSHGGPTSATYSLLRYGIQYWTTRGFAVLDVDYGGSTGYGRDYRERLKGQWGIVDVADCVNGARHLVAQGLVDANRLVISGGSAGGFTTLCALTFHDVFKAGASYFGVSDLAALARDTHKFEARYLDGLIGPYPERADLYAARSPIEHLDQLACSIILLQGLDDPIVPANQAEMMYEAVRARGLPVAYVAFAGEQHGFVKAENNKRALEAELYFYSRVFKFDLAEQLEAIEIENMQ